MFAARGMISANFTGPGTITIGRATCNGRGQLFRSPGSPAFVRFILLSAERGERNTSVMNVPIQRPGQWAGLTHNGRNALPAIGFHHEIAQWPLPIPWSTT